ncbi:unnamed protein product [Ectocarpus sp. 4 AP-2014]
MRASTALGIFIAGNGAFPGGAVAAEASGANMTPAGYGFVCGSRSFVISRVGGAIGGAISRDCRSSSMASRSRGDNVGGTRVRARSRDGGGGSSDGVFSAVDVHPRWWSESDGKVGGPCSVRRSSSVSSRRSIPLACVAPGPASGEFSAAGGRGGGGVSASWSSSASHLSPSRASSTWALSRSPSPRGPPPRTRPSAAAAIAPISSSSSSSSSSSTPSSSSSSSPTSPADGNNNVSGSTSNDNNSSNNGSSSTSRDEDEGWPAPHPSQAYVAKARCGQRYEHDVETGGATRIRAVVSDLDGTLLGPDKLVSATTTEAVRKARAKGILFVPASGRSKSGMIAAMGELGQELQRDGSPFVCMNGLTVYGQGDGNGDLGEIIHSELMCLELAARVVAFWKAHPLAKAAGVSLCGSEGETIVVETLDPRTSSFPDWGEPLPKEVRPVDVRRRRHDIEGGWGCRDNPDGFDSGWNTLSKGWEQPRGLLEEPPV